MAWIESLFRRMVELGASDLHMTSGLKPRMRLDGDIVPIDECPELSAEQLRRVLLEVTPDENKAQFESERDTDFAVELARVARFRANLFIDHHGPGACFRVIPSEILSAEKLGLPKAALELCYLSKGLVLVTGPTGSGKSTTLAAMIDHINATRQDHIITIEDPIEFVHKGKRCLIHQREVGRHTDSFKRALRAALREDPDIVLVGELRDLETVEIAIETAETGHLVFATLHTTTAATTVDRVIDQFPADRQAQIRTMLAASLKGVISQTLCKRIPSGRVAAHEVMIVNNAISTQIREGKTHQIGSAMQMGGRLGMRLLNDSLAELVSQGLVDPREAYVKAVEKESFQHKLNALGIQLDLAAPAEGGRGGGEGRSATSAPQRGAAPQALPAGHAPPEPVPGAPLPAAPPAQPHQHPPAHAPSHAGPGHAPAQGQPGFADPFEAFKHGRGGGR